MSISGIFARPACTVGFQITFNGEKQMYMSKRSLVMGILLIVAAPAWCKDYTVAVGVADFDPVEAFNFSPNHLPNQTGDVVQPGDTITFVNAFNDGFHNAHSLDSAFPFQWWVPDTYEGSPVPVAAFLSVASKTAGFVGLLQIMFIAFHPLADVWRPFIAVVAVATMTFGNLVALTQRHIVRLLAYSSIGQAGYILLPLAVVQPQGGAVNHEAFAASIVYLLIYAFMEMGAFSTAVAYGRTGGYFLDDYAGLGTRAPGLAVVMTIFLFSLAGIPPLAGWAAKLFIFRAVIDGRVYWLAAAMAVNTVIALFYYAGVARRMFFEPAGDLPTGVEVPLLLQAVIGVSAVMVVVIGILPDLAGHLAKLSTLV